MLRERSAMSISRYLRSTPPFSIFLLVMLSALAWLSTFSGMTELVNASYGKLGYEYTVVIGVAVATMQVLIIFILHELFDGKLTWWLRPLYVTFYLILVTISVGFSFGFYWKHISSRDITRGSAEFAINDVQNSLTAGLINLTQLSEIFDELAKRSAMLADEEQVKGQTCPNSRPGDGPRRRLRERDEQRFAWARQQVLRQIKGVNETVADLQMSLAGLWKDGPGASEALGSRAALRDLNHRLDSVAISFRELRRDPQLRSIRDELEKRAGQTDFVDGATHFSCPDAQLEMALRGVIRAIDAAPEVQVPKIEDFVEAGAVREAFNRLGASALHVLRWAGGGVWRDPVDYRPTSSTLRRPDKVQPGLTERDHIPLIISIFVDLGIALIAFNRPPSVLSEAAIDRLSQRLALACALAELKRIHPLAPVEAVIFRRLGRLYGAVPVDFSGGSGFMNESAGGSGAMASRRRDTSREPPYLSQAFDAISVEGLARPVGWLGRMSAGLTWTAVREEINRQTGARYAQVQAFQLYRLCAEWPDARLRLAEAEIRPRARRYAASGGAAPNSLGSVGDPAGRTRQMSQPDGRRARSDSLDKGGYDDRAPLDLDS